MSTARHHAEWLSLVEASGPFLSLPVLLKTFPVGLDAHDPESLKRLRSAYEEWQDSQFGLKPEPAIHRAWVEFVLKQMLELPEEVLLSGQQIPPGLSVTIAEQNETLRPDWVVVNSAETSDAGKPRLLVQILPGLEGGGKPSDADDGVAARLQCAVGAGDEWRTLDAGECAEGRDNGVYLLVQHSFGRGASDAAGISEFVGGAAVLWGR